MARVRSRLAENDLWFSDKGLKITREQLSLLDRANVFVEEADPTAHAADHAH
jgi:hypothetical protein